nr:uncharacterized mitochondrial protein AtMg00810-like [Tanacetum cinerariifolium]
MTLPNPQRHVVPTTVLTRSRFVPIPTARPVNTAVPQTKVQPQRSPTHGVTKVNAVQGVKGNWVWKPKCPILDYVSRLTRQRVIDNGCSRNMTWNISYLSDFEAINGGYVIFGRNPKGGKITRKGSGPTWLFDIDTLTKTMNYQPVFAGNQPNPSADPQNTDADTTFEVKEPESEVYVSSSDSAKTKKHDAKTKGEAKGKSLVELSTGVRNLSEEFEDFSNKSTNEVNDASTPVPAVGQNSPNSTNTFSAAGPSNTFSATDDEEDVGAETDFSNLETNITVSPIPTTKVYKDHPVTQIIGDLSLALQTRSMTRMVKDQGKRAIGSKWVFRNKKDERGIVIRNKARLVALGHTQEEGIDYEEVFAAVARIEAIRLFLAYASFMGFMVYQMDVKSAFLYETIKEEALYGLHQAPKAWYETLASYLLENGFQRGKIDQTLSIKKQKGDILLVQVYVDDIIFGSTNKDLYKAFEKLMKDKFQMSSMDRKSASTPIDIEKPLLKDPNGEDVDVHTYRSMIGSLMYLTSSRPDIMFATVVATSLTKAEYVAAASCCAQVLWIQNQLLDYGLIFNDASSKLLLFGLTNCCCSLNAVRSQTPRAWYETLANYLLENGFQRGKIDQTLFIKRQKGDILLVKVYVDDIIFGSTNKDLCKAFEKLMKDKFQMSSMGELTFFLGLQVKQKQDGIFISQEKYVAKILRKFGLTDRKSASTPIDTEKPLLKDPDGEDVDVHTYRSMIGSLMYLTSSRPDIMFAVCACARFQVTPKASHLHAVKRILRYLKGKPHLGLWYLKDSPFNLMVYSDSDYAGASLDKKSIRGGC